MGYTRLLVYLVGLILVVMAAWIFLTRTPLGASIPSSVALAIILLLVGIGVMASAKSINDARYSRRIVQDGGPAVPPVNTYPGGTTTRVYDRPATETVVDRTRVVNEPVSGETYVEERRWD